MERAELAPQLELTHEVQPKIQEGTTHDKEEHILAFDDGNTSLIERIQRQDNNCHNHESRRQRPCDHVDRQFVHKGRFRCCCCYYCFFFLHSHTKHATLTADTGSPPAVRSSHSRRARKDLQYIF